MLHGATRCRERLAGTTGSESGEVILWDVTTARILFVLRKADGRTNKVLGLAFHPDDSKKMLVASIENLGLIEWHGRRAEAARGKAP
jgi:WD40 repeat protein